MLPCNSRLEKERQFNRMQHTLILTVTASQQLLWSSPIQRNAARCFRLLVVQKNDVMQIPLQSSSVVSIALYVLESVRCCSFCSENDVLCALNFKTKLHVRNTKRKMLFQLLNLSGSSADFNVAQRLLHSTSGTY